MVSVNASETSVLLIVIPPGNSQMPWLSSAGDSTLSQRQRKSGSSIRKI
jgi:hypothetical protein